MSISVRRLENPTPAELDKLAHLLRNAFDGKDYLTDGWCQGDEDLALEQKRAIIAGAVVNGLVFVAKYEDEDLVGVVAIFGPGHTPLSTEEARAQGFNQFLLKASPEASQRTLEIALDKYSGLIARSLSPDAWHDEWGLTPIAVSPKLQGKGIGKTLLKACEDKAKATKNRLVLLTDSVDNVPYYLALGYTLHGQESYDAGSMGTVTCSCFSKDFSSVIQF